MKNQLTRPPLLRSCGMLDPRLANHKTGPLPRLRVVRQFCSFPLTTNQVTMERIRIESEGCDRYTPACRREHLARLLCFLRCGFGWVPRESQVHGRLRDEPIRSLLILGEQKAPTRASSTAKAVSHGILCRRPKDQVIAEFQGTHTC